MKADKDFEWKKNLTECLDSTTVSTLATVDENGVWANPVYFSYDSKFNFYFVSSSDTRHMRNIKSDPRVVLSVFTPQSIAGIHQIGVQIEGKASLVPDEDIESVYSIRTKRLNVDSNWLPEAGEGHFVKEHGGVFIKITPKAITYMNTQYFGGNSKKVPLDKLISKNGNGKDK